jgi:hypothetical protein
MSSSVSRPALDRAALERVLARAAELQSLDTGESGTLMTDDQILELGKEVGLAPETIRQAIAEERGKVVLRDERGMLGSWFGAATISAARVVTGTTPGILEALDTVMRGNLPFDISRRFPDRMQWAPRRGFLDIMRSQLSRNVEGADLRFAEEVAASVVPVDEQRVLVRMDALLTESRRQAVSTTAVTTVGSAVLGFAIAITGAGIPLAIPVFGVGTAAGSLFARDRYRRSAVRVGIALEQLLDRLEFGPARRKGGLVDKLLG